MAKNPVIKLKKDEERRLLAGHPWIYSNEIDGKLRDYKAGDIVDIMSYGNSFLGRGYINPTSLISVRLLTKDHDEIDADFFKARLAAAKEYRDRFMGERTMRREIYGESDGLPGLVIDRYAKTLVIQIGTAGMEALRKPLLAAVEQVYQPGTIVMAGRGSGRDYEGLPDKFETVRGPLTDPLWVTENGLQMPADIINGQKTGFFLDQADNRTRIAEFAKGKTVLDVFCYSGALSLAALKAGAAHTTLLDSSNRSLGLAKTAMEKNGFEGRYELIENDAFPAMRNLAKEGKKFDIVSTDPPALAKSKKHVLEAVRAYQELSANALKITAPGGLCIASSCSFHVDRESFRELLARAVRKSGRTVRLLEWRGAAPDHPVHPAVPETDYLKCVLMAVE